MKLEPIAWRLRSQKLARTALRTPADVVSWLGAMQAQDYAGAKWAIGLRAVGLDDRAIDRAFNDGSILRTHVMRPTWHFVAPADLRWIQRLTGPRVNALNAPYYRKGGLDAPALLRGVKVLERSLRNLHYLTRDALGSALAGAGLPLHGQSLAYLMIYAELEGVVCSGPRRGRQFTYALLEERAAPSPAIGRDDALARLASRYFTSHGPATLRDFAWWSGLTVRDGKEAVAMAGDALAHESVDGLTYWFPPGRAAKPLPSPAVLLLPNYDELAVAYRDRVLPRAVPRPGSMTGREAFAHQFVIDGEITGHWRRDLTPRSVVVELQPFRSLTRAETRAVEAAVDVYGAFLGLPAAMTVTRRSRRAG